MRRVCKTSTCLFNFPVFAAQVWITRRNQTILIMCLHASSLHVFYRSSLSTVTSYFKNIRPCFVELGGACARDQDLPLRVMSVHHLMFCLQESSEPGRASIYRSLVANTSKEMMCYSDFPMPVHYPNYLHHSQLLQYLRLYAEHFDLLRHIRFQVPVRSEEPPAAVEPHV